MRNRLLKMALILASLSLLTVCPGLLHSDVTVEQYIKSGGFGGAGAQKRKGVVSGSRA